MGQSDSRVDFLARGFGHSIALAEGNVVLRGSDGASVKLKIVGAAAHPVGREKIPGVSNYFFDNDPKKWRTNVPHYERVEYSRVYPDIDVVYYASAGSLEFDFVVAPGGDPSRIRLRSEGARPLRLDARGDLLLRAGSEEWTLHKPKVYQRRLAGISVELRSAPQ